MYRQEIPLRLQSKPIYQYVGSDKRSDLIQGAVFCFVQGTDPEVLVIIEAVDDEHKGQAYRYAIARMSMVPTQVYRAHKLLWETNWPRNQPDKSYYVVRHTD